MNHVLRIKILSWLYGLRIHFSCWEKKKPKNYFQVNTQSLQEPIKPRSPQYLFTPIEGSGSQTSMCIECPETLVKYVD